MVGTENKGPDFLFTILSGFIVAVDTVAMQEILVTGHNTTLASWKSNFFQDMQ